MAAEWLPAAEFAAWLNDDEAAVETLRLEIADYVEDRRRDLLDPVTGTFAATPRIVLAAKLMGARLKARKGSPAGVVTFAEFGPAEVLRYDPDLERMLGVGRYARPRAR